MNSFLKYQLCLLKVTFWNFKWGRDLLISTAIAAVTTAIQTRWNFIAPGHARGYWISVLAPYVIVLGAHVGWKRFIASWKVHDAQKRVIADKDSEITAKEAKIAEHASVIKKLSQPPDRPQLSFVRISQPNQGYQSGFFLKNHGGVAVEISVERFTLKRVWINGNTLSEIGSNAEGLASVWPEASKSDQFSLDNLLEMAQAELPLGQPLIVSLSVIYRDFENRWYRTECGLRFFNHKSEFGPSRQFCFGLTKPKPKSNLPTSKDDLSNSRP